MNKFNSSKCFSVMRSRMATAPKTVEIEETPDLILQIQSKHVKTQHKNGTTYNYFNLSFPITIISSVQFF